MLTIKFNWRLYNTELIEYFAPYKYEMLKEIFKIEETAGMDFRSEISSRYIEYENEPMNNPDFLDEVMVSDYVCNIHTVVEMQRILKENLNLDFEHDNKISYDIKSRINSISNNDMIIQQKIDISKLYISILLNGRLDIERNLFQDLLVEFMKILENLNSNSFFDDYEEYYNYNYLGRIEEYQELSGQIKNVLESEPNIILSNIISDIDDWVELLYKSDEKLSRSRRNDIKKLINNKLNMIPASLGNAYRVRYKLFKQILRFITPYSRRNRIRSVEMAVSQREYDEEKEFLLDEIVDNMQIMQYEMNYNTYRNLRIYDIEKFFNSNKNILDAKGIIVAGHNLIDKYVSGKGCFAIMEVEAGHNYFALSGQEDYVGSTHAFLCLKSNIKALADAINHSVFNNKYIWAPLSDETKRYTVVIEKEKEEDRRKYINSPILLGSDKEPLSKNKVGLTYGCCERKMQALCNDMNSNKIFYSRWAPCERCMPALDYENGDIKIYSLFKTPKDWTENGSVLEEYIITKSYSCEKKEA